MPIHDVLAISQALARAEAVLSVAAKAAGYGHAAYVSVLNKDDDATATALRGLRAKLQTARREAGDLAERVGVLLGETEPAPRDADDPPAPDASPSLYERLVTQTRRVGQITNARAQKQLGVRPAQARKLLNQMVREGVVVKASRKLYTLKDTPVTAAGAPVHAGV